MGQYGGLCENLNLVPSFAAYLLSAAIAFSQEWQHTGLTGRYINSVYVDHLNRVYAATWGDSVFFMSSDDGATWQTLRSPRANASTHSGPAMLAVNPLGHLFCANNAFGLHRTEDGGSTWSSNLTPEACASIAVAPWGDLFAGLTYSGIGKVFHSTDNGTSWTWVLLPDAPGFATLGYKFNSAGDVFAETIAGVYRSTDSGATWARMSTGYVRSLAVLPNDAMVTCNNLSYSTNRGETWTSVTPSGIPMQEHLETLVAGPDGVLYGQTDYNVYQSIDLGATWTSTGSGLQSALKLAASSNGFLYAGTYQGVFKRSLTASTGTEAPHHPGAFVLQQNYPNPFNPTTRIAYTIPNRERVSVQIMDVLGREIATLVDGTQDAGEHLAEWNPVGLPSGLYFYRLQAGAYSQTKKAMLMK